MAITNALIKRIKEIESEGQSFKDSNFYKDKNAEIEQVFLPRFNEMAEKFSNLLNAYNNLKSIPEVSDVYIDVDQIKKSITALKDKVVKDDYDKLFISNLKKNLDSDYNNLSAVWRKYISDKTSARGEMILTLDKFIAGMPEKETLQLKKSVFTNSRIGNPNAVKAIEDYIDTYDQLMSKLNLKDNVLAFLKKLTSGERISVTNMDDDVFQWIKSSDFADKIILRIG